MINPARTMLCQRPGSILDSWKEATREVGGGRKETEGTGEGKSEGHLPPRSKRAPILVELFAGRRVKVGERCFHVVARLGGTKRGNNCCPILSDGGCNDWWSHSLPFTLPI